MPRPAQAAVAPENDTRPARPSRPRRGALATLPATPALPSSAQAASVEMAKAAESAVPSRSRAKKSDSPFSLAFREYVDSYVASLAGVMRLGHWTLVIDWSGTQEECYASITPDDNSVHAVIALSPTFLDLSPERQRQTLVHELVHCHLFPVHDTAEDMLEVTSSFSAFKVASKVLNSRIETAVDALADVISPLCPPFCPPR